MMKKVVHSTLYLRRSIGLARAVCSAHQANPPNVSIDDLVGEIEQQTIEAPARRERQQFAAIDKISSIFNRKDVADGDQINADEEARQALMNQISTKMNEFTDAQLIIQLLRKMPDRIADRELFSPIVEQIEQKLDSMDAQEIIDIFAELSKRFFRNADLLTQLAEQLIRSRQRLNPNQLTSIAFSIRKLSFYHPRLMKYLVSNFANQVNRFNTWSQISSIAQTFSLLKLNSPTFWRLLAQWMNSNLDTVLENSNFVQQGVSSCAVVNVPTHLIEKPINFVVSELKRNPKVRSSAIGYLNIVHNLAILKSLSNYEANKVLQPEFFDELNQQHKRHSNHAASASLMVLRSAIRILQIGAYCRYDLSIEPKLPSNVLDFVNQNIDLAEKVRHSNSLITTVPEFRQHLYLTAPLNTFSVAPCLDISTGAFVDAQLWVNNNSKILPISEGENSTNAEKVSLIFASYSLLTNMDAGSEGSLPLSRPLGELKMNLRHLHAAKMKPVVIDYNQMTSLSTPQQKIKLIKDAVTQPYEEVKNKDWH